MKIALVFDGIGIGGIERVGGEYVKLLIDLGHEVSVINLNSKLNEMEKIYPNKCKIYHISYSKKLVSERYVKILEYSEFGKYIYPLISIILFVINTFYKFIVSYKIKKINNCDIAIAFSGHFNDLSFIANKFIKSKKYLAWLHGAEFEYRMISSGYFMLYKQIKNLICLSEMCDVECKKFNDRNNIIKYKLYNPCSIKERKINLKVVEELKRKYGKFCLMVARMEEDKDQKTAIHAIKYLINKYNNKINLLLVGDGSKRKELERLVKENELEEVVHFIGNRMDVENYYKAAFIYVHSSPMEGLPTVLLEAMAYDLPIVSTDSIPGVREILCDGKYGLISPIYDFKSLGENIMKMYEDSNMRFDFTNRYKDRINDFDYENIKFQLNNILINIISKGK